MDAVCSAPPGLGLACAVRGFAPTARMQLVRPPLRLFALCAFSPARALLAMMIPNPPGFWSVFLMLQPAGSALMTFLCTLSEPHALIDVARAFACIRVRASVASQHSRLASLRSPATAAARFQDNPVIA